MEEELEFLDYFHNIIKLEKDALARIISIREKDVGLGSILKEQILMYRKFDVSVGRMIENRKKKASNLSLFAKIASHMSVKMIISKDTDLKIIYDILIKRYNICIQEITSKLKEKNISSKRILNLSDRFIAFENENIVKLNRFCVKGDGSYRHTIRPF